MAKELRTQQTSLIGASVYATVDRNGQRWNATAFEAVQLAHWTGYAVVLAEATGTGYFTADMPAGIPAGPLTITLYQKAGATPNPAADGVVGSGGGYWTGTAWLDQTGDSFARLGAPAGNSVSADVAAVAAAVLPFGKLLLTGVVTVATSEGTFTVTFDTPFHGNAASLTTGGLYVSFTSGVNHLESAKVTGGTLTGGPPSTGGTLLFAVPFAQAPSVNDTFAIMSN